MRVTSGPWPQRWPGGPLRSSRPTRGAALGLVERARKAGLGDLAVLVPPRGEKRPSRPPLARRGAALEPCARAARRRAGRRAAGRRLARRAGRARAGRERRARHARGSLLRRRRAASSGSPARRRRRSCSSSTRAAARWPRRPTSSSAARRSCPPRRRRCRPARWSSSPSVLRPSCRRRPRAAEHFEAPLRARVDAGATRAGELAAELRRLGGEEAEVRRVAAEAGERAGGIDVERARLEAEADEARRRLEEAGAEPAEGDDREELAARIERLERRRETLGQVNPLAKEEYEREKERLTELAEQRADLEASLKELEQLRAELAETVERRFDETFTAVSEHFAEVAATLFPGGEGRLRLTEPEEDERASRASRSSCRPRGKRVTQAHAALGRREGARRDLVPVRALPRPAVPVLPARRSRGRARRRQHRPLRRAAAPLLRERAVHRRHAPEEDDGGRRRALRRDDGRRRRLADRLAAPAARRAAPRPSRSALRPGCVRAAHATSRGTTSGCARRSRTIVADADTAFDPAGLWPANEWDVWGSTPPLKDLYCGAGGVIWALDALRPARATPRRGSTSPRRPSGHSSSGAKRRTSPRPRSSCHRPRESSLLVRRGGSPARQLASRRSRVSSPTGSSSGSARTRQRVRGADVGLPGHDARSAGDA